MVVGKTGRAASRLRGHDLVEKVPDDALTRGTEKRPESRRIARSPATLFFRATERTSAAPAFALDEIVEMAAAATSGEPRGIAAVTVRPRAWRPSASRMFRAAAAPGRAVDLDGDRLNPRP
jgi:hypothetical protein